MWGRGSVKFSSPPPLSISNGIALSTVSPMEVIGVTLSSTSFTGNFKEMFQWEFRYDSILQLSRK